MSILTPMVQFNSKQVWKSIVGDQGPQWESWAQDFVDRYPDVLRDIELIKRFEEKGRAGMYPSRVGIVFFTTNTGQNLPVGIMVSHHEGDGVFLYHKDYLASDGIALSARMPKREEPIALFPKLGMEREPNMMTFIANRGTESWNAFLQAISLGQIYPDDMVELQKEQAQKKKDQHSPKLRHVYSDYAEFQRLLTFGRDIPGAFWVMDIDLDPEVERKHNEAVHRAATAGRNVLSGAQPKLSGICTKNNNYYPARFDEITRMVQPSTHIFKIGSRESKNQPTIIAEFLAMEATRALIPDDEVEEGKIVELTLSNDMKIPALALTRFDRLPNGGRRHFTEMTELLGLTSENKYEGSYWYMAKVLNPEGEIKGPRYEQTKLLFRRIVAGLMVGNFDNHFKNFAVFNDTRTLTPNYDIQATDMFGGKKTALWIKDNRVEDQNILSATLVRLGVEMGITFEDMRTIFDAFKKVLPAAEERVKNAKIDEHIIEESAVDPIRKELGDNIAARFQKWERRCDFNSAIDAAKKEWGARAQNGIDILPPFKAPLYRQFAPERLGAEKLILSKSGQEPYDGIPNEIFSNVASASR